MQANEFVKKFGLDAAKHKADELKIIESMGDKLSIQDNNLIRLVESHELVEKLGGLEFCKSEVKRLGNSESGNHLQWHINNVESCQ